MQYKIRPRNSACHKNTSISRLCSDLPCKINYIRIPTIECRFYGHRRCRRCRKIIIWWITCFLDKFNQETCQYLPQGIHTFPLRPFGPKLGNVSRFYVRQRRRKTYSRLVAQGKPNSFHWSRFVCWITTNGMIMFVQNKLDQETRRAMHWFHGQIPIIIRFRFDLTRSKGLS